MDGTLMENRLLRLSTLDNVAMATGDIAAGASAVWDDGTLNVASKIAVGHKVAVRKIAAGEKVIKFGCPIGSATRDIAAGEHVHTHNLKSDYMPTFTLDSGNKYGEGTNSPETSWKHT